MTAQTEAVDLIIAVHDPSRPLQRAVDSVTGTPGVTVTVVCHNISRDEIAATLTGEALDAVRLLELSDGIRSAAGPFNHGIAASRATYVSIMGSDDYLEPGALAAWTAQADRESLTALIAPERHASGRPVRTPPVRPFRRGLLDGVKDRLAYRTAPLGLVRREAVGRLGLEFAPGLATGDDQAFSAKLWFSGEAVAYAHRAPRYVVGDDAEQRVTLAPRALSDELRFVDELLGDPWFARLSPAPRTALAIKLTRVHVFSAASRLSDRDEWTEPDRRYLTGLLRRLESAAPGFARPLSIADRRLLDALAAGGARGGDIRALCAARRRFGRPSTLVARDLRGQLAVEGPLRFAVASALLG